MKKFIKINALILLFFTGCETVVEIDIPVEAPSLVINSTLAVDSLIKIHISKSKHILGSVPFDVVDGAVVTILENETLLTTLVNSTNGWYIAADYKPKKGSTYNIKVEKEGFDTATAQVYIPLDTVKILSAKLESENTILKVNFKDDNDKTNYYEIFVTKSYYDYSYDYSTSSPVLIDSTFNSFPISIESNDPSLEEYQNYGQSIFFNDAFFNGQTYTMNLDIFDYDDSQNSSPPSQSKPVYKVYINNTSKSYYLHELSTLLKKWNTDDPFAQPVTVFNNIENGFGIFGGYNTAVYKVEK